MPEKTVTESELAYRVQAHDEAAFELLYAAYSEAIFRCLVSLVRSEPAAQDLAQEVFLRLWTRADQYSGLGSLKSWLFRIATNLGLNYLRSLKRHPSETLPVNDDMGWDEWAEEEIAAPGWLVDTSTLGPDQSAEKAETLDAFHRALDRLPQEKREVFHLIFEMELSIRDTASRLGIPEGTVKSRLYYAQKQITQDWRSLEQPEEFI